MQIFGFSILRSQTVDGLIASLEAANTDTKRALGVIAQCTRAQQKAEAEATRLTEALWMARRDGYAKADGAGIVVSDEAVMVYDEHVRWTRGDRIELEVTLTCSMTPVDVERAMGSTDLEFHGLKWKMTRADVEREYIRTRSYFDPRDKPDTMLLGLQTYTLSMVAFAAKDSRGPPKLYADVMTRAKFEALCAKRASEMPIALSDGRMGLCSHWHDDGVMVDAYRGNDSEPVHLPWANISVVSGTDSALFGLVPAAKPGEPN